MLHIFYNFMALFSPTFDYEDDFDSETVHEDTSSGSTHSITPTASLKDDSKPSITAHKAAVTNTSKQQHIPLSSTSAAVDKSQPPPPHTSSLLTRSSNKHHSFLQHESASPRTTGIRSPDNIKFKLSPIHTRTTHSGSGLANRSLVSDENSSNLSSESASSTSEAKCVSLTPLHAKQLTASDLFKSTVVSDHDKANHHEVSATLDGKLSTTTLSPLHATGSGVLKQPTGDLHSPERKSVAAGSGPSSVAIGLSPVHTKLSSNHSRQLKVTEHSSPMHKQRDDDNNLLLQLRDAEEVTRTKPDFPKAESPINIPEDLLGPMPDQSHQSVELSVEVQSKSKQEGTTVAPPMKSFLEADKSGLGEDLAELQSALQAAGLPPMTVKDEKTPKEDPTQLQSSWSPRAVSVGTKDAKIPQSSAPVDSKPANFTRDSSESGEQDPTKVSGKPESPGEIGFDLREAIRAIASEELTSISKEILKKQKHSVSQLEQPLHETASASSDNRLECGTESLLPRREGEASHDTYEELEKISDLLADIEHDGETHKSNTKYEGSRKPGRSSVRKLTSTLPKTGIKASTSKEGPASKVDARLSSSKVKANDRTSSVGKSSYRTSARLAELAAPKKINKIPSATSVGSQAKPKHRPQTYRPSTSKSAPPRHPSSGRAGLKQYSGTAAKSASHQPSIGSRQHQIVIPTGSSSALLESQSDSEDEVIHVAHKGGRKTNDERPEIKMDAWKIALQEEKVCSFFMVPQFLDKR